jgi:hypothetical protein
MRALRGLGCVQAIASKNLWKDVGQAVISVTRGTVKEEARSHVVGEVKNEAAQQVANIFGSMKWVTHTHHSFPASCHVLTQAG